jgi:hypothetical protein
MKGMNVRQMLGGSSSHGTSFRVTKFFFDSDYVVRSVDKANRAVLSKFGAFVRRRMRSSIRKRKKYSKPGQPPSSHAGHLRQFIFFSFDPVNRSVVIGPERLNAKVGDTPHVLEYGGRNEIATYRRRGYKKGERMVSKRTITVKARPYARPALAAELPQLPEMWRNSVKP